jgi:predicted aldo/keto reductase-like oxidoreductase
MFITTKAHPLHLRKEVPEKRREDAKKTMDEKFEESLRRLQTDYVDVFFVHNILDKSWLLNQEVLTFVEKIKKQGKARFVGMSIHDEKAYVDAIDQTIKSPLYDVILASLNFKSPKEHGEILQKARKANLGVIAMKTQAGGYQKASTDSVSPHQAALKWVLDKNFVDCAIPGMVNMEQLEENIGSVGKKITWSDRKKLNSYYESIKDRYCVSCGSCNGTCPAQVAIPTVNRALMYCEGYGDFELGRRAYHEINGGMNGVSCDECTLPTCSCVNGIKIPERMKHAHKLFA